MHRFELGHWTSGRRNKFETNPQQPSEAMEFGRSTVWARRRANIKFPTYERSEPSRSVAPSVTGCFINVLLTFCALIGHNALDSSSVSIPLSLRPLSLLLLLRWYFISSLPRASSIVRCQRRSLTRLLPPSLE